MQNKEIELTEDSIGLKRYGILQLINNSYVNFQWEIGKYFIDLHKQGDEEFIASESLRLQRNWGNLFSVDNIRMSIAFATLFKDPIRVGVLGATVSWNYLKVLLPLNDVEHIMSLVKLCTDENLSIDALKEMINQLLAKGEIGKISQEKVNKTKPDKLFQIKTNEQGRNGSISFRSTDILIMDGQSALSSDGIINNLFPDSDLEEFLKINLLQNSVFK